MSRRERRRQEREAKRLDQTARHVCRGWGLELRAYGACIGVILDGDTSDRMPEEAAVLVLRAMLAAMVVDGARLGMWRRPAEWDGMPDLDVVVTWERSPTPGVPLHVARVGTTIGFVEGPGDAARLLLLATLNGLTQGTTRPTKGADTGGYDERNLIPRARGAGDA